MVYVLIVEGRSPQEVDELDQMLSGGRDRRRVATVAAMGGEVVTA